MLLIDVPVGLIAGDRGCREKHVEERRQGEGSFLEDHDDRLRLLFYRSYRHLLLLRLAGLGDELLL